MADSNQKKSEAKRYLELLRQGNLAKIEIPSALMTFGKADYLEARADVEGLLTDPDPEIRETALKVLTIYWYLDVYWEKACAFLEHDPDANCRAEGAFVLGVLKRDLGDRETLFILATVVKNEKEVEYVREAAYKAMRSIVHFDIMEEKKWMREGFKFEKDVNRSFIEACLEKGGV
ncbi:MAG: hypothetical protein ABI456_20425 [Ktedonobacteraceae bacterium]